MIGGVRLLSGRDSRFKDANPFNFLVSQKLRLVKLKFKPLNQITSLYDTEYLKNELKSATPIIYRGGKRVYSSRFNKSTFLGQTLYK